MLDNILSLLAPHYCYGCNKPPVLLCENCIKYNDKKYNTNKNIIHLPIYSDATVPVRYVGFRQGAVKDLLNGYKFSNEKSAHRCLAEILIKALPNDQDYVLTTIPSTSSHVRKRGYDHMQLIVEYISKKLNKKNKILLQSNRNFYQHQKNRQERIELTKGVFEVDKNININLETNIILIDDILTTGSTMKEALKTLYDAGYKNISGLVIACQSQM